MYFLVAHDENLDFREFLYYFVTMLIQDHHQYLKEKKTGQLVLKIEE
jgi:hypothetical protein